VFSLRRLNFTLCLLSRKFCASRTIKLVVNNSEHRLDRRTSQYGSRENFAKGNQKKIISYKISVFEKFVAENKIKNVNFDKVKGLGVAQSV
jgi:hypothetical protein